MDFKPVYISFPFCAKIADNRGGTKWTGDLKCREVKTGFCRKRSMQTSSSETLIVWKYEKPLVSLYGTECREDGYGLRDFTWDTEWWYFFLLRPFPYLYNCIQVCTLSFSLVTVLDQQLSKPLRSPANQRIADNQTRTTNQSSSDRPTMADPDTLIKVE